MTDPYLRSILILGAAGSGLAFAADNVVASVAILVAAVSAVVILSGHTIPPAREWLSRQRNGGRSYYRTMTLEDQLSVVDDFLQFDDIAPTTDSGEETTDTECERDVEANDQAAVKYRPRHDD